MVSFENTRFDPDLTGFHAIAQQWHRRLDTPLICPLIPGWRSFLRLRVAQLNLCSYCLILHSKAAK